MADPGFKGLMHYLEAVPQGAAAAWGGATGALGIRSGRAGTAIGQGKNPFFSGLQDPNYVPRTWMQVYDDMMRGSDEAMFDPHWYEMLLFEAADPLARGGLVYAQGGGLFPQIPEIGGGYGPAREGMGPIVANAIEDIRKETGLLDMQLKLGEAFRLGPNESMIGRVLRDTDRFDPGFVGRFEKQERLRKLIEQVEAQIRENNRALGIPDAPPLPRSFQNGGSVFGNRHIFKPKGTDTIPAMLSPGEFVVRRDAVNAVGVDTLRNINSMGGGNGVMTAQRGGMIYAQGGFHAGPSHRGPDHGIEIGEPDRLGGISRPWFFDDPSHLSTMMGWDIHSRGRRDRILGLTLQQIQTLKQLVGPQDSVRNIDTLSDKEFEGIMEKVFAESKRAGLIEKGKTHVGDPTGRRYANAPRAQRKEKDKAVELLRRRNLYTTLEQAFEGYVDGFFAREAGLLTVPFDDEMQMIGDPGKAIASWVREWGGPPLSMALRNRTKKYHQEQDEKTHGKFVTPITAVGDERGVRAGARPGLFIRKFSGEDRPRIRDVARPRGRGRFGVTGSQFRGAGTTASDHLQAAGVADPKTGLNQGRFDIISSVRAEKARREEAKAQARTDASNKRVKKQKERVALDKLRQRTWDSPVGPRGTRYLLLKQIQNI